MLARKTAAKKAAIAAHSSSTHPSATPSGTKKGGKRDSKGPRRDAKGSRAAESARRGPSRADAIGVGEIADRSELIRSIGDNVNTRLLNIAGEDGWDDDLDDPAQVEEKRHRLMEEARMAAGMQQRVVSSLINDYYGGDSRSASGARVAASALVRVKHNCNAITAVAALGLDLAVLGDKSGKVYMVDLGTDDAAPLFATHAGDAAAADDRTGRAPQQRQPVDLSAYRRRRKVVLEPALPAGIVSLAISDTRGHRPSARELFEKSTVDTSCVSYTAAGAEDGSIAVWETLTQRHKGLLFMHRKAVTGLSFRLGTADLYSASEDGTLRVWSVPQMMTIDKLFGHEGKVHDLNGLRKETCASVGDDGTMRFWKIDAATQQSYSFTVEQREEAVAAAAARGELDVLPAETPSVASAGKTAVMIRLESVAMLNESSVLCGAVDGSLVLFDVNKRKPVAVVPCAHGYDSLQDGTGLEKTALRCEKEEEEEEEGEEKNRATQRPVFDRRRVPNAITAVAAVPYADVVASASNDGVVRLWRVSGIGGGSVGAGRRTPLGEDASAARPAGAPSLRLLAQVPVHALVTSLRFSPDAECLFVACSKECRRGRWTVCRAAQNGVAVVPLTADGAECFAPLRSGAGVGSIVSVEHVPSQLFAGLREEAEESAQGEQTTDEADGDGAAAADDDLEEERLSDDAALRDLNSGEEDEPADDAFFAVGADGQLTFSSGATTVKGRGTAADEEDVMAAYDRATPAQSKKLKKKKGKSVKGGARTAAATTPSPATAAGEARRHKALAAKKSRTVAGKKKKRTPK